jgi:hypothetical protein
MVEAELAVLVMALAVGLLIGLLIAWASLLASTGHPARPVAREAARPAVAGRRLEPHTGRAVIGALLALLAAFLVVVAMVPGLLDGVPPLDDLPASGFVLAFAVLLVSVGYALPTWLGVRQ